MDDLTLLGTAVALGMDAFAVGAAVAAGLNRLTVRNTFRLTWHFGLFQSLMTLIGWFGGAGLSVFLHGMNNWIAFGLLLVLGLNMIREAGKPREQALDFDPTRGWSLVGLSVATSIDALAVGVSLSLIGMTIVKPAVVIGLTALTMTFVAMQLGKKVGGHLGQWAERGGGVVLILVGLRVLFLDGG